MPVSYKIAADRRTIRTKCSGDVTLQEVIDHFTNLLQDPECPERLDVLLDLSEATSLPETRQLLVVTTELKKIRSKVNFDACAILASRPSLFGMMRMFEVLAEGLFRASHTFQSATEAEAWLLAKHLAMPSTKNRTQQ